jgi:hypothetical protein
MHLGGTDAENVVQRDLAVPVLRDVKLARRLAQSRDHKDRPDRRPGHRLPSLGHHPGTELVEAERAPKVPRKPHVAEAACSLNSHARQPHSLRRQLSTILEQFRLFSAIAEEVLRERSRLGPLLLRQRPQIRHRLLPDLLAASN